MYIFYKYNEAKGLHYFIIDGNPTLLPDETYMLMYNFNGKEW